jgi:pectin methylesterase-like acyl-CoA thioesterase
MLKVYVVDQKVGPYKKIQEAIDACVAGSTIEINSGLYQENLYITKGNLVLQPSEGNQDVIIVVSRRPTLCLNLQKGQTCRITGLKICHTGNSQDE